MINRTALIKLRAWKTSKNRHPLILRGARQVGKTTIINEFGKEFDSYLYFNLEVAADKALLESELPLDAVINLLYAARGMSKYGETLIFIDEIQNSPKTIALLRFFYERRPDLYVVAAGSLLENVVDVKASFPVGRVDFMPIRPCSFCEFMQALSQQHLMDLMAEPAYAAPFHNELLHQFNQYCIVGGMPEVVQEYVDTQDVVALDHIFSRLIRAYIDDVDKYANTKKVAEAVRFIINYGWSQAGAVITMGNFLSSGYNSREIGEAFRLLQKAMLLELAYPTTSTQLPLIPEMQRMPKLLWFDTGLVNYNSKVRQEIIGARDILDVWKGRIGEQIVGQELLAINNDINETRMFWTRGRGESGAEIDFLRIVDSTVVPIEVKAGHNSHLRSLHSFVDLSDDCRLAVRVWSGQYQVDEQKSAGKGKRFRLVNLPFYMLWNIDNIIRQEFSRL